MHDILLVEDNRELAAIMKVFLEKEGYSLYHATSGEEALAYLKNHTASLLLLDIMLPELDGFAVCKAVREGGSVPILILSAMNTKEDQLNGFRLGADDFMEKPVDIQILAAKIKALLQRAYGVSRDISTLKSGGITIDMQARKAFWDEQELELNVKEYELLLLFAQNPGKTLHKEYLFSAIWGIDSMSENQTLTVHIKMLRGKIERNPRRPERIQTVWGIGYRYEKL